MNDSREPAEAPSAPAADESVTPVSQSLQYFTPSKEPTRIVTIGRLRPMEAQLARAKLESEGVRCFLADEHMAAAHPLLLSEVRLQVAAEDAARAEQILARPAEDAADDEYVEESFRCPRCHRRQVELMPLSRAQRRIRAACLILLAAPFLLPVIEWIVPDPRFHRSLAQFAGWATVPWMLLTIILIVAAMLASRRKRCADCAHEWSAG